MTDYEESKEDLLHVDDVRPATVEQPPVQPDSQFLALLQMMLLEAARAMGAR